MCNILIISDSTSLNKRISKVLEKEHYTINTTTSALKGLDVIESKKPNLIILEILMPDMSGFELISKITSIEKEAKIIAMTSGGIINVEDYLSAIKSFGADMVLKKPFRDGYLLRMVNILLKEQINLES